jgi:hypothetical protein
LAAVREEDAGVLEAATTANAQTLFGLHGGPSAKEPS